MLADELVEPILFDCAVAIRIRVDSMVFARRFAVDGNAEADGLSVPWPSKDERKIASMKAVEKRCRRRKRSRNLALILPFSRERPLVELQDSGSAC